MLPQLKDLNSYVHVENSDVKNLNDFLNDSIYEKFDLVIVTEFYPLEFMYELNNVLRKTDTSLIVTACSGLMGFVFTDFGENHTIFDKNGEPKKHVLVTAITPEGQVTTEEKKRHDLEEGDLIRFDELIGLEKMNGQVYKVEKVLSPFSFKIQDVSSLG